MSSPASVADTTIASPYRWSIFEGLDVDALVSTREGGVSTGAYGSLNLSLNVGDDPEAVLTNRRRAAALVGASIDDLVFCQQVAGRDVAVVTAEHRGRGARETVSAIAGADALITSAGGSHSPVLAIMAADCVPLVLFDPVRRVLGCVHAGWAGTVRGVTTTAVEKMKALGSRPCDLVVGIGPSISPARYHVGPQVVEAVRTAFGSRWQEVLRRVDDSGGKADGNGSGNGVGGSKANGVGVRMTFDLWQANLIQLTAAGVPLAQVQIAGLDTGPGTPFFSHRSEAPCGRFAALARITEESV